MGAMLADARHRDALADWRKRMRERVQADGNWTIELDTPAQLNEAMDAIGHYFACLVSIGLGGKEIDRFVCPIEIVTGFVAPFHLVTGLLVEFKDAWEIGRASCRERVCQYV